MASCSDCKFSFLMSKPGAPEYRVCRRHPPTPHLLMQQMPPSPAFPNGGQVVPTAQSVPPPVQGDWWCGEHELLTFAQPVIAQ